ncbi:unnamed protein product [Caenorhabditis auriculariae]|uniref:Exportin-T n=1 Tax=Caenorhabditis auriculariae TaxID=2777116 RepID=A0A8S1H5Q0_9PELO|nr:unnamed protein product [Caenorhabditis auriculariae]
MTRFSGVSSGCSDSRLCWLNANSILEEDQKRVLAELAALTEPELAVLNNSNPELSELSIDVLKAYLSFLIRNGSENEQLSRRVIELAFSKYIMGEGMNIDGDGEDETEFVEYRKDLRSLLNVIGTKRPELVLLALEPWTAKATASGGAQIPINQIEALLQIVFSLHEIIPSNLLQSPREGVSERACRLPLAILENLVLDGRSTTVHVVYFELACRYERLLAQNPQPAVPLIAAAFLDERGIAIPAVNVRTRIVYLFCRFVKAHKVVLSPLVSEVVKRLAPLLAVAPESENSSALSSDDQAYIFEATATLIVFGELDVELKSQYFGELASTLAIKFEAAVTELSVARSQSAKEEELKILQFMSNIIAYCSRMSKAFNNVQSMKSCNCVDVYLKLLKLFLSNLNAANVFILESVRQFAHRLVVCLEAELLPYLREIFEKLAEASTDLDTMNHLMIFCHQTVAKYKKDILTSGVDIGNVLVTAARFSMQEQENIVPAKDDSQRALVYVQRSFVQLLHAVIVNDCWPALQNSNGLLDGLLETTMRLAMSGDQTSQKLALATLARATQKSPAWSQRTLRVALEVPALPHITPSDAGSTLVVHEACATLLTLFGSDPTGFSQAVRELLPSPFSDQLINALSTLKGKNLDKEVMNMYVQLKSRQQQQRQQIA